MRNFETTYRNGVKYLKGRYGIDMPVDTRNYKYLYYNPELADDGEQEVRQLIEREKNYIFFVFFLAEAYMNGQVWEDLNLFDRFIYKLGYDDDSLDLNMYETYRQKKLILRQQS
jgi:hypothetical protein